MRTRLEQLVHSGLLLIVMYFGSAFAGLAAPYAALVMDARTGEVLHSRNADTRLHPASLTKMMTLYVVFDAIERGEISLDTMVKISRNAAAEPPSKLGLQAGQRIQLRYLIRAAAVKSANDAATALGEAISGSEAAFAKRMNSTAKALGMTNTTFKNAHGLTREGHLSTARDMTLLGRHLFFDHPDYYNLFSRLSTNAGIREVPNTNRRFLAAYKGADGIKTGYTRAAGFNLVASAVRGDKRIIATMFGGRSTAARNARVAELLDMGFKRAPANATVHRPSKPNLSPDVAPPGPGEMLAGKTIRVIRAVSASPRPMLRPTTTPEAPPEEMLVAMAETIEQAVTAAQVEKPSAEAASALAPEVAPTPTLAAPVLADTPAPVAAPAPTPRPVALATLASEPEAEPKRTVVTRLSTSGGRLWGINVGRFTTRDRAERVLLKTALAELGMLDNALRKVASSNQGHDANFVGMTHEGADRACRRLQARNVECTVLGPA